MLLKPLGERREIARDALVDHPGHSDRRLSRDTGLSREMIGRMRADLERVSAIPANLPIAGDDGKIYRLAPRTRTSFRLMTLTAKIKEATKVVGGASWRLADPRARRLLWLAAVNLADTIGDQIDPATGHIIAEPPHGEWKDGGRAQRNSPAQTTIALPSDSR